MSKGLNTVWKGITGESAADAATEGAQISADSQMAGLDYLKETEAIPQELRQQSLTQLGSIFGLGGDTSGQQQLVDQAKQSPLYQSLMGGQMAGQEAVARSASATGGLRGGGTVSDLANYNTNLQNNALMQSYNQQMGGLQGLAGLPSQAGAISQQMGNIGATQAQGVMAASQAQQQGLGNMLNLAGQIGTAFLSDMRLKTNIKFLETTEHPDINRYSWDWTESSGKEGHEEGFLAQEVETVFPDMVIEGDDGFKRIYKDKIETKLKELN